MKLNLKANSKKVAIDKPKQAILATLTMTRKMKRALVNQRKPLALMMLTMAYFMLVFAIWFTFGFIGASIIFASTGAMSLFGGIILVLLGFVFTSIVTQALSWIYSRTSEVLTNSIAEDMIADLHDSVGSMIDGVYQPSAASPFQRPNWVGGPAIA